MFHNYFHFSPSTHSQSLVSISFAHSLFLSIFFHNSFRVINFLHLFVPIMFSDSDYFCILARSFVFFLFLSFVFCVNINIRLALFAIIFHRKFFPHFARSFLHHSTLLTNPGSYKWIFWCLSLNNSNEWKTFFSLFKRARIVGCVDCKRNIK